MAKLAAVWNKAFASGSKSLQDRLKKVHANNPEFQSWLKSSGHGAGESVKQASKEVKPTARVQTLQQKSLKAYGATKGTRMGSEDGSGEAIRDTIAPLTRDQHAKVQAAEREAKAAAKKAAPAAPKKPLSTSQRLSAIAAAVRKAKAKHDVPTMEPDDEGHDDLRDVHQSLHIRRGYNEELVKELRSSPFYEKWASVIENNDLPKITSVKRAVTPMVLVQGEVDGDNALQEMEKKPFTITNHTGDRITRYPNGSINSVNPAGVSISLANHAFFSRKGTDRNRNHVEGLMRQAKDAHHAAKLMNTSGLGHTTWRKDIDDFNVYEEVEQIDESKTPEYYDNLAKKHTADGQKGTRANMVYANMAAGRASRAAEILRNGGSQEDAWKHYQGTDGKSIVNQWPRRMKKEEVEQIDEVDYEKYLKVSQEKRPVKIGAVMAARKAEKEGDPNPIRKLANTQAAQRFARKQLAKKAPPKPYTPNPNPYGYGEGRYMGDSVENNGDVLDEGKVAKALAVGAMTLASMGANAHTDTTKSVAQLAKERPALAQRLKDIGAEGQVPASDVRAAELQKKQDQEMPASERRAKELEKMKKEEFEQIDEVTKKEAESALGGPVKEIPKMPPGIQKPGYRYVRNLARRAMRAGLKKEEVEQIDEAKKTFQVSQSNSIESGWRANFDNLKDAKKHAKTDWGFKNDKKAHVKEISYTSHDPDDSNIKPPSQKPGVRTIYRVTGGSRNSLINKNWKASFDNPEDARKHAKTAWQFKDDKDTHIKRVTVKIHKIHEEAEQISEQDDTMEKVEMAQGQLHFICYAAEEIIEFIKKGGEVEEWYQNKLSKVHSDMESLHSYVEGEMRRTGMKEEVEQVDEVVSAALIGAGIGALAAKRGVSYAMSQTKGNKPKIDKKFLGNAVRGVVDPRTYLSKKTPVKNEEAEQVDEAIRVTMKGKLLPPKSKRRIAGGEPTKSDRLRDVAAKAAREKRGLNVINAPLGFTPVKYHATNYVGAKRTNEEVEQVDEKAPPGAKYERMVKHIKKGYSKGGLTDKEKSIAYATAWKAHNKANEEAEGTVAVTPKEKALAAHHGDKTKITYGDVIKARLKSAAAKKMGK